MSEREKTKEESPKNFKEKFKAGLKDIIDMAEQGQSPASIDPFTMGTGEKNYEEQTTEEKKIAKQLFLSELGLEEKKLQEFIVREYSTTAPEYAIAPGEIKASVFKTNQEGVFLQRLTYTDKQEYWVVGPDQDI